MMKMILPLMAAASVLAATPATAATAIEGFTGGSLFTGFSTDETVGFKFTANAKLKVLQVGWFATNGTTINASHQIGIWDVAGNLLGSATVTPGAADPSGFRYANITQFFLFAGQDYFIGGRDLTSDGDSYRTGVANLTTNTNISFLGTAVSSTNGGFAFPGTVNANNTGGRFGPNFQFSVAGVPEPTTWAMLILGFGVIGGAMRSARRQSVHVTYA
jgi:PEP-CTERM motif